jgi:hypothetical protein
MTTENRPEPAARPANENRFSRAAVSIRLRMARLQAMIDLARAELRDLEEQRRRELN